LERIEPGQFQESAGGARVFFIDKDASGKEFGSNVFIAAKELGKESITSARSGRIQHNEQGKFLLLSKGQRLEIGVDKSDLKISEFEEYGVKISSEVLDTSPYIQVNTLPTLTLLKQLTPVNLAELSWRIGLILAAINFVIIGVAVSSVKPRVGRSTNLVFSLFAFVLYYNLLNLGQSWIASGKYSFTGFLLTVHGGAFALGVVWLARGHHNWHWQGWPSLRTSKRLLPKRVSV
jgi:lipopolysaccharide export system permease protein